MKILNYFFQFFFIILLFILFKILGYRISNKLSGYLFLICGPIFRNNEISKNNLQKAFPKLSDVEIKKMHKEPILIDKHDSHLKKNQVGEPNKW